MTWLDETWYTISLWRALTWDCVKGQKVIYVGHFAKNRFFGFPDDSFSLGWHNSMKLITKSVFCSASIGLGKGSKGQLYRPLMQLL